MISSIPFTFASPLLLAAAVFLTLVVVAIALLRRIALPASSGLLMTIGIICLCLAAGGMTWLRARPGHVAVVVDVSPSTRTATFHDRDALKSRIIHLLGNTPYSLYRMSGDTTETTPDQITAEEPTQKTRYAPPAADAVALFSDGQFSPLTAVPPTYVVIDPALDNPQDASVTQLEQRSNSAAAAVHNNSGPRTLNFANATPDRLTLHSGDFVEMVKATAGAQELSAYLLPQDRWPENDELRLRLAPPVKLERWWVGSDRAGAGWRRMDASQLPTEMADYLAVAVIVLDNIDADHLDWFRQAQLERYVRDLGGGLVILGGPHAFAAGGYPGSALERLSPLASVPPVPVTEWIILADSSGSMAAALGDNTRWSFATDAIARVLPLLPPDDLIRIGDFAGALRWWSADRPVHEVQARHVGPRELQPTGPTNLGLALKQIVETTEASHPTQMLLITDAETTIDNPSDLAGRLAGKKVHVHGLISADVPPENPVRRIIEHTGGQLISQSDPRQWAGGLKQLFRSASSTEMGSDDLSITFTAAGPKLASFNINIWNRTWLKPDATELAGGMTSNQKFPAIAAWHAGTGAVIAAAFSTEPSLASTLADRVATPPRDPRFSVTWRPGRMLRVTLDAVADSRYINDLAPILEWSSDGTRPKEIMYFAQTAPGRYEAAIPASKSPGFAGVYLDGQLIDRIAIAGRYPPEFDAIGNNRANLEKLARQTGGGVIEPTQTKPIDFHWPVRPVAVSSFLAAIGAGFITAGLIRWRAG